MSTVYEVIPVTQINENKLPSDLAVSITRAASKQTYHTIRLLADRDRRHDAYQTYGYFRWVDDRLDQGGLVLPARIAFVERQQRLIDQCYRNRWPVHVSDEEQMLVNLIRSDTEPNSGLQAYIRNMMAVMDFDARRRGRLISAAELNQYTRWLAIAVTEAMHHFIGHGSGAPQCEARYLAVTAAHITHMLRDAVEDAEAGYFNIPREIVQAHGIDPREISSAPYRAWVSNRVSLARRLFKEACSYLCQVESARYRLAAYGYMARFEVVLDAIERDGCLLRAAYPERKSLAACARMGWSVVYRAVHPQSRRPLPQALSVR